MLEHLGRNFHEEIIDPRSENMGLKNSQGICEGYNMGECMHMCIYIYVYYVVYEYVFWYSIWLYKKSHVASISNKMHTVCIICTGINANKPMVYQSCLVPLEYNEPSKCHVYKLRDRTDAGNTASWMTIAGQLVEGVGDVFFCKKLSKKLCCTQKVCLISTT